MNIIQSSTLHGASCLRQVRRRAGLQSKYQTMRASTQAEPAILALCLRIDRSDLFKISSLTTKYFSTLKITSNTIVEWPRLVPEISRYYHDQYQPRVAHSVKYNITPRAQHFIIFDYTYHRLHMRKQVFLIY